MKKDLFGYQNQGVNYDIYRPRYPKDMIQKTMAKVKGRNRYIDIATGTGQILFEICHHFKHSEGLDLSKNMIDVCENKVKQKAIKNVAFRCEDFIKAQIKQKYDLITIGQALHWLPIKDFLIKSKQSLEPNGMLAVYGYILNGVQTEDKKQSQMMKQLYIDFYDKKVKKNFDFDRDQLHTHYSDKNRYPFEEFFTEVSRQIVSVPVFMNKNGFLSYLKTFSGYNTYLQRFKDEKDPIKDLEDKIPENAQLKCLFDYFTVTCAK